MQKVNVRNALAQASIHARILLNGLVRTIYGSLVAILFGVSIYGFISLASEDGYLAVFDFIASVATLAVALCNIYCMGKKKRGAKK